MRKSYFRLLEGVLFSLPLLFASCGNGDNALEEIINGGGSEGGGSSAINATAITLKQTMKVLVKGGDALTITATATPAEATLTWESSDEAVATVVNGVVTPKGVGITTITAKSGDVKATCEVFVGNEVDVSSGNPIQNFDILKGTQNSSSITIPDGCKVAFNGVTTDKQIICEGTATIILADGSENEVTVSTGGEAGIEIGGDGKTLTINGETAGDGKLTVQGGYGAAGIGTNVGSAGGNIVINGGTVTATGGDGAAGIGTGYADGAANECGTITINGGTVTATGGGGGAGIGTGVAYGLTNTCGDITINGGTVTATGYGFAAGIGTGFAYSGATNECGAIKIGTGVTSVTATKGTGAGSFNSIGTGKKDDGGTQTCGDIYFDIKVATAGTYSITTTDGTYTHGGLNLVISGNDWTLTPAE